MIKAGHSSLAEEVRERVLIATRARFGQYGYNKTTMAEIAKDCDMSAANLYRFFEDKQAIGAALACQTLAEKERRLRDVIVQPGLSATQRLEAFVRALFRFTYEQFHDKPRIGELVEMISRERADIIGQHKEVTRSLLATVLAQGNASGEFDVRDPSASAETVIVATTIFCVPYFLHWYTREQFEQLFKQMMELIVRGLEKR